MKRTSMLVWISMAIGLLPSETLVAQTPEPLFGTWRMNAAKSKYSPGPLPKSNIAHWQPFQGGVKVTNEIMAANGEGQHWESSGKFDGKDNPIKGNNPDANTMAVSKTDARTYDIVWKSAGKKTLTARIVMAADGKTRVTTMSGTNNKGETVHHTIFYEKQ